MNILKIIEKNTCLGQKLYTPVIGVCYIKEVTKQDKIVVSTLDDVQTLEFNADGKCFKEGETLLFPSKEMRDWKSFAWKEGDILTNPVKDDDFVRFWKWNDDEYTTFKIKTLDGKCCDNIVCRTLDYIEANEEEKQKIEASCLRPGQKVLVRSHKIGSWSLDFFSHYDSMGSPICIGNRYFPHLMSYKGNQHLLGTTKDK